MYSETNVVTDMARISFVWNVTFALFDPARCMVFDKISTPPNQMIAHVRLWKRWHIQSFRKLAAPFTIEDNILI